MNTPPPARQEQGSSDFEARLQASLLEASQTPGAFVISGGMYPAIMYHERIPPDENSLPGELPKYSTSGIYVMRPERPPEQLPRNIPLPEDSRTAALARHQLITGRRASVLIEALGQTDLEPGDLMTITHYTLSLWSEMMIKNSGGRLFLHRAVARAILNRALDFDPQSARQAFGMIAKECVDYKDFGSTKKDGFADILTHGLSEVLRKVRASRSQEQWHYNPSGPHVKDNFATALEALDKAGLYSDERWRKLLQMPFHTQPYGVIDSLAYKIHSDPAGENAIFASLGNKDRIRAAHAIIRATFARAAGHQARDPNKLATAWTLIVNEPIVNESVSLKKLVSSANTKISLHHQGELTPQSAEKPFIAVAQSLALLLRGTLRGDAPREDAATATAETATMLRLLNSIIERTDTQYKLVLGTVGDLALRFADATPEQFKDLENTWANEGLEAADALRWRQLRA
jgi:hypothetical protein